MAETVPSPAAPRSRGPRLPAAGARRPPSIAELRALTVYDIPKLPSLAALRALTERDLPSTDGVPMPESSIQFDPISYSVYALRRVLRRRRPDVFVAGDLLVYQEGRPDAAGRVLPVWVAPDVLVSFGVEDRDRDSYVIWQEGKPPDFVMEIASTSTWKRDRDEKPAVYASLGVGEYFLFDAVGGRLEPRLQGHALRGGAYRPLPPEALPNGEWGVRSEVLGLCVYSRGTERALRWFDPTTGRDLEDYDEVHDARDAAEAGVAAAEARATEQAVARRAAEERIAELEAQVRRLRRGPSGT